MTTPENRSKEQLKAILAGLAVSRAAVPRDAALDVRRQWLDDYYRSHPQATGVTFARAADCGPLGADIVLPPSPNRNVVIVYLHGGGFMLSTAEPYRCITTYLAKAANAVVIVPDYRRAPEHTAPTAFQDALAAYEWALSKYPGHQVAVIGDSAGGNMAISVALNARDRKLTMPSSVVAWSPWLNLECDSPSCHKYADDPIFVSIEFLKASAAIWAGGKSLRDPDVTPYYRPLNNFPPTLIHVGSWEALLDDSVVFAAKLREHGNKHVSLRVFDGMIHVFQTNAARLDDAMISINESAAFMTQHGHRSKC